MWDSSAVGKPQAVLSEEELAEKQANREGALVLLKSPNRSKRRSHPRRSVTRSSSLSRGGELQMQQIPSERTVSSFHRNGSDHNTTNNRSVATRGMVLPFQPLSISFNDISYFVDLPAVLCFAETPLPHVILSSPFLMLSKLQSLSIKLMMIHASCREFLGLMWLVCISDDHIDRK